jgi:hypothetical protein
MTKIFTSIIMLATLTSLCLGREHEEKNKDNDERNMPAKKHRNNHNENDDESSHKNLKSFIKQIEANASLAQALVTAVSSDTTLAKFYLNTTTNGVQTVNSYTNLFACSNLASPALSAFLTQYIAPTLPIDKQEQIKQDLAALNALAQSLTSNNNATLTYRFIGELFEHNYASLVSGCMNTGLSVNFVGVRQDTSGAFKVLNWFYSRSIKSGKEGFLCGNGSGKRRGH